MSKQLSGSMIVFGATGLLTLLTSAGNPIAAIVAAFTAGLVSYTLWKEPTP